MKVGLKVVLTTAMAAVMCCTVFAGCFGGDGNNKNYTVQYTDDDGTHQILVADGEPYRMENVPQKTGYDFLGLFDSEQGGKQYVSAQGASLNVYNDGKSIVLFPQWKAKTYNVVLDFQGAEVTESRLITVEYGSVLPQLPIDLQLEHKEFCGWFTKENCGGTQIADKFGLLPIVSVVNEENFDLSQDNARISLYAGFTAAMYSVTLNFGAGLAIETVNVPYGTNVKNLIYSTRNAGGQAVLSWSRTEGDANSIFTGYIEQNTTLYAYEWANMIEFDTDGGNKLAPVVAATGDKITLPEPEKNLYHFLYWENNGQKYTATTMPAASITLKAVWQAKLVFDSNGGESVKEITDKSGILITLPNCEREGFIFAGWFTSDGELYASRKMPSSGILLKAGWYREKTNTVVEIQSNGEENSRWTKHGSPNFDALSYTFKFLDYFSENKSVNIIIDIHAKLKTNRSSAYNVYLDLYSQKQISSNYLLETKMFNDVINEYKDYNYTTTVNVNDNFYMCWYSNLPQGQVYQFSVKDFYYVIHYPDTSNLFL